MARGDFIRLVSYSWCCVFNFSKLLQTFTAHGVSLEEAANQGSQPRASGRHRAILRMAMRLFQCEVNISAEIF